MQGLGFIKDLAVVLVISGLAGWACQRIGLSLIIGYLVAGAIIGPFTPPFQLVTDLDRVQMLSQLGLVFLTFSIGLNLGLQRLQRLGLSIGIATLITAVLVLNGGKILGATLGWNSTQSLFTAGMLMVSSSAIISKVLQELNAIHSRPGQLALGVTVLEDVVAVVMITLLSTLVQLDGLPKPKLTQTVGALGAFVMTLLILALLLVPRLLSKLANTASSEIRTLLVIGLLLSLAWVAAKAGYSLALGAFLIGVIVASTPQRREIERMFEGMRDLFGAVFFVAMGMLVDFHLLAEAWPMVLVLTAFAIFLRPAAAAIGLSLIGHSTRDSVRAGIALTPLGEFSFIIAQLGVAAGVVPKSFYPMAVGASILTTLIAPFMMRRSEAISERLENWLPLTAREWIGFYDGWLKRLAIQSKANMLWNASRGRVLRTLAQVVLVSALVLFANPIYQRLATVVGHSDSFPGGFTILFWTLFGLILIAPLVDIWRNVMDITRHLSEAATQTSPRRTVLQPLVENALRAVAGVLVLAWLLALLPFGMSILWASAAVVLLLSILSILFSKRLIAIHERLEGELQTQLKLALGPVTSNALAHAVGERQEDWKLQIEEFILPDFAKNVGKSIGDLALRKRFGCSVVSIDRQGYIIANPSAETIIYPQDKLILLGSSDQIQAASKELGCVARGVTEQEMEELSLEVVTVPQESQWTGKTLQEIHPMRNFGIQITGVQRGVQRTLTPKAGDHIEAGDQLLVLGTPRRILLFRERLNPVLPQTAPIATH